MSDYEYDAAKLFRERFPKEDELVNSYFDNEGALMAYDDRGKPLCDEVIPEPEALNSSDPPELLHLQNLRLGINKRITQLPMAQRLIQNLKNQYKICEALHRVKAAIKEAIERENNSEGERLEEVRQGLNMKFYGLWVEWRQLPLIDDMDIRVRTPYGSVDASEVCGA